MLSSHGQCHGACKPTAELLGPEDSSEGVDKTSLNMKLDLFHRSWVLFSYRKPAACHHHLPPSVFEVPSNLVVRSCSVKTEG